MVRLILFDIDGTLILSGGAGEKAFARVCELEFGVRNGTAALNFAGRTDPAIVREFFEQHSIEPNLANFQRFFERYVFLLDHMLHQLNGHVLPGVATMLAELDTMPKRPLVGLLTGNIRLGAQIKLNHYRLWPRFEIGAFGDDHENRNQLAVIAKERGSQRLGEKLAGDQILVIGDTPRDIECARAVGARALAVATGKYSVAELQADRPTWTVASLAEVSIHDVCR
jgi:phosphoglycolate phosphatase